MKNSVRVVSLSLGLPGYHDDFHELMVALRARGVLPVVAVGNEGPGTSRSPGNYDIVLSVGACDKDQHVAYFSSSETYAQPVTRGLPARAPKCQIIQDFYKARMRPTAAKPPIRSEA